MKRLAAAAFIALVGLVGTGIAVHPSALALSDGGSYSAPAQFALTQPTIIPTSSARCWSGERGVVPTGTLLWDTGTYSPGTVLCWQTDGNLVIYQAGHVGDPNYALWQSHTSGNPNAVLVLQSDGNLVIYQDSTYTTPLWNSMTYGHPGDCALFQPNGDLAIYSSCRYQDYPPRD